MKSEKEAGGILFVFEKDHFSEAAAQQQSPAPFLAPKQTICPKEDIVHAAVVAASTSGSSEYVYKVEEKEMGDIFFVFGKDDSY